MTFVTYTPQGIGEETKDLSIWMVSCPDCLCYSSVAIDHATRERASEEEFLNLLSVDRRMLQMEMQDLGCDHDVPPIEEWEW
ncbi:MAG: hypothetical protein OK436_07530 [Thaumarchaeota archaeon]|nr:hypothetical protein [Nitrososphaerota archaeon]